MRSAIFAVLIFAFVIFEAQAQPGSYLVYVNVVDRSGEPIRDAWVKVIPRGDGAPSLINPSAQRINIFDRSFLPADGSWSRFVAMITSKMKGEYEVEATAEGFHPLRKAIMIERDSPEHEFVLEPNGQPRPKSEPLVTLSGKLTNTFGEAMYGLRVRGPGGGYFYSPDVDKDGNYSIQVVPGNYRIEFWPSSCTKYTLEEVPVGKEGKVLNLTTECIYPRPK